jgi:Raf kinase inhibitor-like YbhB/YbcL family protein
VNRRIALTAFALLVAGCSGAGTLPIETSPVIAVSGSEAQPATPVLATSAWAPAEADALALHIDAFEDGGAIPDTHTCIGDNESPAVSWSGVPAEAQSLVLIVYDADAGADLGAGNELGFLHWMVYDISPMTAGLPLAATGNAQALAGGIETSNDFSGAAGGTFPGGAVIRGTGYDGPCPPAQHTYVFRLLALSQPLGLKAGTPYQSVMSAVEGSALAVADWTGIYPPSK